jgi:hypothetical protein
MVDQKSLSCQNKKTIKVSDYTNPDLLDRRWKVSYGRGQFFYLTDTEHKFFLGAILAGEKHVQIGLLTLSNNFFYILPTKNMKKDEVVEEIKPMTEEEKKAALNKAAEIKKNLVNILNKKDDTTKQ